MNVLLSKGDEVVCMAPMYQSLYQIAKDIGCRLTLWEPIEENGAWDYAINQLNRLITEKTMFIFSVMRCIVFSITHKEQTCLQCVMFMKKV